MSVEHHSSSASISPAESLRVAVILSLCGGFLDAFTWLAHDRVLANAQTANVVLLGVYGALGQWEEAFRHLPPIVAFIVGVFVTLTLRDSTVMDVRRLSLMVEIGVLFVVMVLHLRLPDVAGTLGISFAAAMQTTSFAKVEGLTFSSVMTTGNLGRFTESIYAAWSRAPVPHALRNARIFATVSLSFGVGAGLGAFATVEYGNAALAAPIGLLAWTLFLCRAGGGIRA